MNVFVARDINFHGGKFPSVYSSLETGEKSIRSMNSNQDIYEIRSFTQIAGEFVVFYVKNKKLNTEQEIWISKKFIQ